MAEKQGMVRAEDVEIDGSSDIQYAQLGNIRVRLARPITLPFKWVGGKEVVNRLMASWYCPEENDVPMNPRLIGKPGVGKTALAYAAAELLDLPVYFFQATSDTQPNDVLINPVIIEVGKDQTKVEYIASTLISAMIMGGAVVFDEGNRMQEKAWAALAPLLDSRRYVESAATGVLIKAHPNFRFVSTMNDDASCFELPEYIKSRLQPQIVLDFAPRDEERRILRSNLPNVSDEILDYVAQFLDLAHRNDERFSVREGIHIAHYADKTVKYNKAMYNEDLDPGDAVIQAVQQILGVRQARYIKRLIWEEREAA